MGAVKNLCKRGIVLDQGQVAFDGDVEDAICHYQDAGMSSSTYKNLSSLPRSGKTSQSITFSEIEFLDKKNNPIQPRCGQFLRIKLTFKVSSPITNCNLAIGMRTLFGTPLLNFAANTNKKSISFSPGFHSAHCDIEKLPLTGGVYKLGLWAEDLNGCADFIDNVITMDVDDDDFFGHGKGPSKSLYGKIVLCENSWEIQ